MESVGEIINRLVPVLRLWKNKGKYFIFEGIDGSGKSTQLSLFCQMLKAMFGNNNPDVVVETKEPGSPLVPFNVGDLLRKKDSGIGQVTRELLFQAERAEHNYRIDKLVQEGKWVISDRSFISGLAYGEGCGNNIQFLLDLTAVSQIRRPDMVFMIYIDPQVAGERRKARGTAETFEEAKGDQYLMDVQEKMVRHVRCLSGQRNGPASTLFSRDLDAVIIEDKGQSIRAIHQEVVGKFDMMLMAQIKRESQKQEIVEKEGVITV